MSSADVDYYDVQRMVEDAESRLRGKIDDVNRQLQFDVRELAGRIEQLAGEVASLSRVLQSRTEHLA